MAKDFFDKNGLSYEEVDVSIDEEAAKSMIEKTNQMGVPVIEIGDEVVVGFDRAKIEEIIASAK
jgi:glutaredoxin